MNLTSEYRDEDRAITFRRSLGAQYNAERAASLIAPDDARESDTWWSMKFAFAYIVGYVETVEGLDWTPPRVNGNADKLEESFQAFLHEMPDSETFNAIQDAIFGLFPLKANRVEAHDATLTDEERADPN